ncbi:uncharacterized protein [Nicotiana sylvestris]|uniref:uncharacterized protein n=1 Tax=Nicotiana sylvestris TaxID=4096 RepID=UPI00388CDA5C
MTNPQDKPGTPPQPTPSDSSTPPPPSTTPKPRLRRVKMLARKIVTSGDLSKKLNENLKAQESPSKVSSSLIENLENRFVLVGTIRDVELPEVRRSGGKKKSEKEEEKEGDCGDERGKGKGVVDHSPTADLSVPSICGVEQENVEESGKKSEGSGSSEATEGKKKRIAKGKSKVAESSEAIDIEEMEQVHQEEVTTVEVETPKPKKPKTSSKKSSSVSEATEPHWPRGQGL